MKKILILAMVIGAFALVACGGDDSGSGDTPNNPSDGYAVRHVPVEGLCLRSGVSENSISYSINYWICRNDGTGEHVRYDCDKYGGMGIAASRAEDCIFQLAQHDHFTYQRDGSSAECYYRILFEGLYEYWAHVYQGYPSNDSRYYFLKIEESRSALDPIGSTAQGYPNYNGYLGCTASSVFPTSELIRFDGSAYSSGGGTGGGGGTGSGTICNYCQGSGKCYAYGTGCNGTGICKQCNGTGQPSYYDRLIGKTKCTLCSGNGKCPTCNGTGLCTNCGGTGYAESSGSGGSGSADTDYTEVSVLKISATKLSSGDYSYSQSTESMYKRYQGGTLYLYTRSKSLIGAADRNTDSSCGPYSVSRYSYRYFTSPSLGNLRYYYFD